ncbi:MAG: antitoxin [Pseudomonadota bacterium]
MQAEYDLSKMKSRRNPFSSKLKQQVTVKMPEDVVAHFKRMSDLNGIPYQNLINLYLRDCMIQQRKINVSWATHNQSMQQADVNADY